VNAATSDSYFHGTFMVIQEISKRQFVIRSGTIVWRRE